MKLATFTPRKIIGWLMAIGVALRLHRYLTNRSLWLDEAYLANSILTFSFKELLTKPLTNWQAAPPGFLLLEKLAVTLFGTSEYALRLMPLIAGIASIPLFYGIIRRLLLPTAQVAAMAFFIIVEPLVYYAAEAKQYGGDVTIALALLLLALRYRENPLSVRRLMTLAIAGMVAIFCSHPSIFVLAATGMVLLADHVRARRAKATIYLCLTGGAWVLAIAANYAIFLRPLLNHAGLAAYWANDFMPRQPIAAVKWIGVELYDLFHGYSTMWLPIVDPAIFAAIVGLVGLWRRSRATLALVLLPILLTLAAAAVHGYPFGSRLVLFLIPLLIVLIGEGGAMIWESIIPGRRFIAAIVLAAIFAPTAGRTLFYLIAGPRREEIKPVLAYIRAHHQPGDTLYIFQISQTPFHYYQDRFGLEPNRGGLADMRWVIGQTDASDPFTYRTDLAKLRGRGRVWILITHPGALGGADERQIFPVILNEWGTEKETVSAFNACAMLYDMNRK